MADKPIARTSSDAELKSAIVAFEQILDAEPNDRLALETLSDAYERVGDKIKALTYLNRLGDVVANEGDVKAAQLVSRKITGLGKAGEYQHVLKRLQDVIAKGSAEAATQQSAQPRRRAHDITREVSLAWDLLQAEEISQEDYAIVVQDLSENSTKTLDVPVTVLHALQDRNFAHLERILAFLARSSGKPLISLAHFEIQLDLVNLLPQDFMLHRGAIIFERIGSDLLVAVLNPFDTELQEDVRKTTDQRCHFCLTSAADYDNMLINIRKTRALYS